MNTVGSGTVTKNPNQATYHYGDVVQLTAIPSTGWSFGSWSGDLSGSTNPQSITITGNKTVAATFSFVPVVSSVVRSNFNPTSAESVKFTVTFSKSVTGVNTEDFALFTVGITNPSITGVSGSGTTYTVTVNTGSGNGTLRLDVVDDDSIKDVANNPLGGVGVGNGNYTSGEIYNIIKIIYQW